MKSSLFVSWKGVSRSKAPICSSPSARPVRERGIAGRDSFSAFRQCLVFLWAALGCGAVTTAWDKQGLQIVYLARDDEERTRAFETFFSEHFEGVTVVAREKFEPEMAREADVVVLDWPQSERLAGEYESPLGSLEDWEVPTVFLGSAGLQMAGPWYVIGGAG